MKIAVLGAKGFIGSALVASLDGDVTGIDRTNYDSLKGTSYDVFINAAGQNSNFWGHNNPHLDFAESTQVVYNTMFDFAAEKYIYISSVAAYDKTSNYGYNKTISEDIVRRYAKKFVILRCCSIIDPSHSVGIIPDVIRGNPLFVTADSKIQFITRKAIVDVINTCTRLNIENDLFNIGGDGPIVIEQLSEVVNKQPVIKPDALYREYNMDVSHSKQFFDLKTSYQYVQEMVNGS